MDRAEVRQPHAMPAGALPVGAIDIGSNSIRMAVAQVAADGGIQVLERAERAVHLGQDAFAGGRLLSATMSAAIAVLGGFRRILDTYQVRQVRAVATSAVREAANADAFLDRIAMSCGLEVEVISTSEESRLTVSAVRQALATAPPILAGESLIVDVGGGSALLTVLRDGDIVSSASYRLGAIRLRESLATAAAAPDRAADLLRHQIAGMMTTITSSLPLRRIGTFIAVGTDARFAAARVGKALESAEVHVITRRRFDRLVARCEQASVDQLARQFDLAHAEAQTLVPALLVHQALLHGTAAAQVVLCHASMRDGLLLDLARNVTGQEDEDLARGAVQAARAIGEKYRFDAEHAGHVADLAVRLFDELRAEHGLKARHRLLLRLAALLHEIGGFVSSRAHHKHSYYLVAHAEVFGLSREELEIVAQVARYHRRSPPQKTHPEYMALAHEKRVVVCKLAAILRVADALDGGHGQQVRDFRVERRGGELVLVVQGAADLTLERRAVAGKSDLFGDIYGMPVRLEAIPLPPAQVAPRGDDV